MNFLILEVILFLFLFCFVGILHGIFHIEEKIEIFFIDTCTSVTHASMIPNVIMRTLYLEMTPYIRGEKTWEECYGRFLNMLTLYANG